MGNGQERPGLPIQSRNCLELIDINIQAYMEPPLVDRHLYPPVSLIQNAFCQARGCFTEVL